MEVADKVKDLRRLEAQRNELNAKGNFNLVHIILDSFIWIAFFCFILIFHCLFESREFYKRACFAALLGTLFWGPGL